MQWLHERRVLGSFFPERRDHHNAPSCVLCTAPASTITLRPIHHIPSTERFSRTRRHARTQAQEKGCCLQKRLWGSKVKRQGSREGLHSLQATQKRRHSLASPPNADSALCLPSDPSSALICDSTLRSLHRTPTSPQWLPKCVWLARAAFVPPLAPVDANICLSSSGNTNWWWLEAVVWERVALQSN